MKRIGILTFQNAFNYGAVLQAYALKTCLEKSYKCDVQIINYKNEQIEKEKSLWSNILQNNVLKEMVRSALLTPYNMKLNHQFNEFCNDYLQLSNEVPKSELPLLDKDLFIVGSDQVWNSTLTNNDTSFFFDFVKPQIPCASYAASIGASEFSEEELTNLKVLMKRFDMISFREKDLVPIFKKVLPDKVITACLDPVFLLSADNWKKLCSPVKRKPYVLFFCVGSNPELEPTMVFAKQLAKEKGLDTVYLSNHDIWYKYRDWSHCGAVSPNNFLGYIENAQYVVTNSFHATAFSIIFHKKFYSEIGLNRSGRIKNVLEISGLTDRAVIKGQKVCKTAEDRIDWDLVERSLESDRGSAYGYLRRVISLIE